MKHRCMIVDDEPLAIEIIAGYLERFRDMEVAATCRDAVSALDVLNSQRIDLMFLDIQMPHIKGTDFLRALKHPPKVIITTAFREFALEGYELDVLDYLLKPISFGRFMKAVEKYLDHSGRNSSLPAGPVPLQEGFINVMTDRKTVRLPLERIIYVEGMKDYVNIVTEDCETMTHKTMHGLLEMLPAGLFLRIHRSYIISVAHVTAFNSEIIEIGGRQLPIGRHYRARVLEVLGKAGD